MIGSGRRHRLRTRSRSLFDLDRRLEGDEIVLEHHMRRSAARLDHIDATLTRMEKLTLVELRNHKSRAGHGDE